jgi:hypothetical protein
MQDTFLSTDGGFDMLYKKNDIMAMAVVYEGHLPKGHKLDERKLASELLDRARQSGLPSHIKLSPHTAIRVKRANESAYYTGSYKPTDDFPAMIQACFKEVRENIIANGEKPGPVPMRAIQFKGWSSVASISWVAIQIKQ